MIVVEFADWENREVIASWFNVDHWVLQGEQVWLHHERHEVVRVEHVNEHGIICFVRKIN